MVARAGQNSTLGRASLRAAMVFGAPLLALAVSVSAKIPAADVVVDAPVYEIPGGGEHPAETWTYDFTWSRVPVGAVELSVGPEPDKPTKELGVAVTGRTNSVIDLLWRYRLSARGTILTNPFRPGSYRASEQERSKRKLTEISFDEERQVNATRRKGEKLTEVSFDGHNTYDIISVVFAALSFEYEEGASYDFDTLTGSSRYLVSVTAQAREPYEAAGRTFDAWRLAITTRGLSDPEDDSKHNSTHLWVSADQPRRLLGARSELFFGSINVRLSSLRNGAEALDKTPSWRAAKPRSAQPTPESDRKSDPESEAKSDLELKPPAG